MQPQLYLTELLENVSGEKLFVMCTCDLHLELKWFCLKVKCRDLKDALQ